MKQTKFVLSALALLIGVAAAEPSGDAASLAILATGVLCYSAQIEVNDKADPALSLQAEAIMLKTLKALNLKAEQYDAAETCDQNLDFTFSLDVAGAPSIYSQELVLQSYTARVGDVEIDSAIVWSDGYWGGDKEVWSRATYTKRMTDTLSKNLSQFTTDYRSLKK